MRVGAGGTLAGRPGVVAVNVRDRFNHPQVPDEDQELAAELIDKDGNSVGTTTVSQREGSTNEFIVIYRSHQEGEHKLSITLDGQHIVRSPFSMTIQSNDIKVEELRVHNNDLIWDSDIALMWEQKHVAVGSAKAAADYLSQRGGGSTQVVSIAEALLESEDRFGHYIQRKKTMSLHSRIANLAEFYTPSTRIRRPTAGSRGSAR